MKSRARKTTRKTSSRRTSRTKQTSKSLKTRKPGTNKNGRSWALYGRAGSGKTTLAGTFPRPILFLDCRDEGDDSLANEEGIEIFDVSSKDDLEEAYWYLHANPGKFKTVVWDTGTGMQQILVEEKSGEKARKSGKVAGDWGTMTKSDWGDIAGYLKTWITNYRDLPMEVVFIAQDRVFNVSEDDNGDEMLDPEMGPALSPAVMKHLCASVSIVGHTLIRDRTIKKKVKGKTIEKEVKEYSLRLGPSASYITKFRKPKEIQLPNFLVDPTYEEILETIIEGA